MELYNQKSIKKMTTKADKDVTTLIVGSLLSQKTLRIEGPVGEVLLIVHTNQSALCLGALAFLVLTTCSTNGFPFSVLFEEDC